MTSSEQSRAGDTVPRSEVRVAAVQMSCSWDLDANLERAEQLVREAADRDAQIVLLPELFQSPYFCCEQNPRYFELAEELADSRVVARFRRVARELEVVLPLSFFERAGQAHFNSLAMIDADGEVLGLYRKSHIPDGPGYQEKFYFAPGDTGFRAFRTRYATVGAGICWDQWYPESARAMMLLGAEILFYPTAIGSEPADESADTRDGWQRAMQGHATSNAVPVVASNRYGQERFDDPSVRPPLFYGSSFITDETGAIVELAEREGDAVLVHAFDRVALRENRATWGFFRDRRPNLYEPLASLTGSPAATGGRQAG
ncbi:MAG: N-carbamoylputrescine amidase [Acidobacteria bacterium]|nr:MAG: N-carbamoylputrescine amidase [Acidobacteriota bacterium]REK06374.1 MAG: N-carbamoylputrescine amidase [Acidobacteriota bacterium]